jgi:hypothetical protein
MNFRFISDFVGIQRAMFASAQELDEADVPPELHYCAPSAGGRTRLLCTSAAQRVPFEKMHESLMIGVS